MPLAPRNALEAGWPTLVAFKPSERRLERPPERPIEHLAERAGPARGTAKDLPRPPTAALLAFPPRHAGAAPSRYGFLNRPATGPACPTNAATSQSLSAADRIELLTWHAGGGQGYTRMILETGSTGAAPDLSGYALLYPAMATWAALGIARTADGVLVWHCATGAAHGVFPSMSAALRAVPPAKTARNRI